MNTTLQELADQFYAAKYLRILKEKEAEDLKQTELKLKEELLHLMLEEKLTVVGAQTCIVRYHRKIKPIAEDWEKIWGHIQSTGDFDLLHKRLTEAAVQSRWGENSEIPGIGRFPVDDLTVVPIR